MTPVSYVNIAVAILGLLFVIYAIRSMPPHRCSEPLVGDALILVAYLLMINSYWMAQQSPFIEITSRAWHVFDLAVLINIVFHARHYSHRRGHAQDQRQR